MSERKPAFRVWLCGPMRVERWESDENGHAYTEVPLAAWGGRVLPRLLFKALLLQPHRRALRSTCNDLFRSSHDSLTKALKLLRRVLTPTTNGADSLLREQDSFCTLAGQERIWVDVDAAFALLKQAEWVERTSPDRLMCLEQAAAYFNRGSLLEGESWPWAQNPAETTRQARYRCLLWLAEEYEAHKHQGQALDLLNGLHQADPADTDVLARLLVLLTRAGMGHQARVVYRQAKCQILETFHPPLIAIGKQLSFE